MEAVFSSNGSAENDTVRRESKRIKAGDFDMVFETFGEGWYRIR